MYILSYVVFTTIKKIFKSFKIPKQHAFYNLQFSHIQSSVLQQKSSDENMF
jgi:hypothetical protein